ncbi:MAG: Ldh family oxidoreductase [Alphaproteobacteria bacterium]
MDKVSGTIEVAVDHLAKVAEESLRAIGVPDADIGIVRDVLLYAELRGNNQGLVKIPARGVVPRDDAGPIEVARNVPCAALINANGNSGMAAMALAADEAALLAESHGVGIVGVNNLSTSTGAIGFYADRIARSGHIGIVFAGSVKAVAVAGSVDPVLGTNPVAIGIPASGGPVVLDMATAAMAWYGLVQADQRGQTIPDGVAFDADGAPTNDPVAAMAGAIKAFAGNKGSGLALMVEILTGPLIGAALAGEDDVARNFGDLVIALSPAALGPPDTFRARVDRLLHKVKSGRRADGVD